MEMAVGVEVRDRVAVITLRRPEARNAVNAELARALDAAVTRLETDDDLWVGILAAEGPVFSAGADLKEIAAGRAAELSTPDGGFAGLVRHARRKPLIAAVQGPALAGGLELVLACDLVVAAETASFGLPEVKRSLVAAAGGLLRLPQALPRNVALELALTGEPLSAERAHALGLVNRLVPAEQVLDAALELAARIVANAPVAVRESRDVLLASAGEPDGDDWRRTAAALSRTMATEDFNEGPRAFIEKRAPAWTGR